jgi:hypothetical protein
METTEKKIVKTKTYQFKVEVSDDGESRLTRTNDGFNSLELIGICTQVLYDLIGPSLPKPEFEKITRRIVEEENANQKPTN